MTTEAKVIAAAVYGTLAFKNGIMRAPAMDKNIDQLLAGNQVGEGLPVLKAWIKAWDCANLSTNLKAA